MKIIKVFSKKVKDVRYDKYLLNLPKKVVEDSKLLGKDLKANTEKDKIIIEKEYGLNLLKVVYFYGNKRDRHICI